MLRSMRPRTRWRVATSSSERLGDAGDITTLAIDLGFVYEHLMNLGPRFKVGVLRETARDELGWAPNHLLLLYREVLPKGTDPTERANELRNLALAGHFDTWEGR